MTKYKKHKRISSSKNTIRLFLGICVALVLLTFVMSFSPQSKAQWFGSSNDDSKSEITQMARERNYVGGADEDDLRVLPQLPVDKNRKQQQENTEGF